jgi:hypothetical protein
MSDRPAQHSRIQVAGQVPFDNTSNKFASAEVQSALVELDGEFKKSNTLIVDKAGNDTTGDGSLNHPYLTIAKALSMVASPGIGNPWKIIINPGIFSEAPLTLPAYTRLQGSGDETTIIEAANPNAHLITAGDQSHISNCLLTGATGSGYALIYYRSDTGSDAVNVTVEHCRFGAADILVWANANTVSNAVFVNSCYLDGGYSFNKGFLATTTGAGKGRVVIRGTSTNSLTAPLPAYIAYASGAGCEIVMNGNQFRSGTTTSGSCIQADNGGYLRLLSVNIKGFATAVTLLNNGAAPTIRAAGMVMDENTKDIDILHAGATGQIFGVWSCLKTFNVAPDLRLATMCTDTGNFGVTATMRIRGFGTEPTITASTLNGTLVLDKYSNYEQEITGSAAGFAVRLPVATTLDVGRRFEIYNASSVPVTVQKSDGTTLFVLSQTSIAQVILETKLSAVGTWIFYQIFISSIAQGILNYSVSSDTPFASSVRNPSYELITGMSVTPQAGTYRVDFNASTYYTTTPKTHWWAIFKAGVKVANTQRSQDTAHSNQTMVDATFGVITFDGTETCDVRISCDNTGTATVGSRTLALIRLG